MIRHYWLDNPDDPFYDLLTILNSQVYPESMPEGYEELKEFAKDDNPHPRMVNFKAQLIRALQGDTEGLHPDAIFEAASYDDGSDEAFLKRLWSDLYPDEPLPTPRS